MDGRVVICGVGDERDAPAVGIAQALAGALGLPLLLVHVLPPARVVEAHDLDRAGDMLRAAAEAAGVSVPGDAQPRVLSGGVEESLADFAASQDAVVVVVGETSRSRLRRSVFPSLAGRLSRRCPRPVLACPRNPART